MIQALSYAAIILYDAKQKITKDKLKILTNESGIEIDSWTLDSFVHGLNTISIDSLISNFESTFYSPVCKSEIKQKNKIISDVVKKKKDDTKEESSEINNLFEGSNSSNTDEE